MADVYTVVFAALGILLSLPALLVALNLLFPQLTKRVQIRLVETPSKCFFLGVPVMAAFALWIAIASQLGGPGQALAYGAAVVGTGVGSLGGAGFARLLGERLGTLASPRSELTNLTHGAIVFELACLFPIVGWLLFIPLAGMGLMGAAVFALLGWLPRRNHQYAVNSQQSATPAN